MSQWINVDIYNSPIDMSVLLWVVIFHEEEHKNIWDDHICVGFYCSVDEIYKYDNAGIGKEYERITNKITKVIAWTLLPDRPLRFLEDKDLWTT